MSDRLRASWGVSGTCSSVSGVVVGISGRRDGSVQTETDENGAVCGVYFYDSADEISCDVQVRAGTSLPTIGSSVSIGFFTGFVKGAEYTEQNTAYCKIRVSAQAFAKVSNAVVVS